MMSVIFIQGKLTEIDTVAAEEIMRLRARNDKTLEMLKHLRWLAERSEPPSRIAGEWESIIKSSGQLIAELEGVK